MEGDVRAAGQESSFRAADPTFAVVRPVPCDALGEVVTTEKLKVSALTVAEWCERNAPLGIELECAKQTTIAAIYEGAYIVAGVLTRKSEEARVDQKPLRQREQIKQFAQKRGDHARIGDLCRAIAGGETRNWARLVKQIGLAGWRPFLASASRSTARASFAYLARTEGWRTWGFASAQ